MKQLTKDFTAFALSGNVLDLAIGVILGAAFNDVVQKFAQNVLLQLVAATFGKPNFDNLLQAVNGAPSSTTAGSSPRWSNFLIIAFTC